MMRRAIGIMGLAGVLAACAPLPGSALDPLGPTFARSEGPPSVRDQWIGRYEDSRGSGELTIQVRRSGPTLEGVWQLRSGGDGTISGTVSGDGSGVRFQMRNREANCVVVLDGVGAMTTTTWTATYDGIDCWGRVGNGRFTLSLPPTGPYEIRVRDTGNQAWQTVARISVTPENVPGDVVVNIP